MNYNKNVVVFTLVFTIILLGYSLFSAVTDSHFFGLENISIVSDILKSKKDSTGIATTAMTPGKTDSTTPAGPLPPRSLEQYKLSHAITDFSTDVNYPALGAIMRKLSTLKEGKKGKVRIAWLGDSFIEGDQLTKTVRRQLQQYFGGTGVGFVPVTSVTNDGFRTTLSQNWTGEWKEENFKDKTPSGPLYLSGRLYHTTNGNLHIKDLTPGKDSTQRLEKSLICGQAGTFSITVNGQVRQYTAPNKLNRIVLDSSTSHSIDITVQNDKLPVYGISIEPQSGVVVDNFSFRGISGEELGKLDTSFVKAIQEQNKYDLVVLEYGVNVLYRPDNTDFAWHKRSMMKVLARLHAAMPNTEFLIISTSDRGFRYADGPRSAVGIYNLVKTQAEMAYENNMAFFNMFTSMGGAGTIVRWADSTPVMAGHDYVHPNGRGAEILGSMFYDAFVNDYNKATHQPLTPAKDIPATKPAEKIQPPAPQPAKPAADSGDYFVTGYHSIVDRKTGLEWYIAEDKDYTWADAKQWAEHLAGCKGRWGIPDIQQVMTLYTKSDSAGEGYVRQGIVFPAKINHLFRSIGHGSWVWTNQEVSDSVAYSVNLNQGVKIQSKKDAVRYPIRVFAVRKWEPKHQ